MTIQFSLEQKIKTLEPQHYEVVNESHLHHRPGSGETHFKVLIVSEKFLGLSRLDRQRKVHELFNEERERGIHALSLRLLTGEEWESQNSSFVTPRCAGHTPNK